MSTRGFVDYRASVNLYNDAKRELMRGLEKRGFRQGSIDGWLYDPRLLSQNEYRGWWWAAKNKLPDPITKVVEPWDELRPYLLQDGTPLVYNVIKMWIGTRIPIHPPVKALPKFPEYEE